MVCTFCGAPSDEGAMICSACLKRLHGVLYLREWAIDPRSDLRSLGMRSACLRVGPSSQGEVLLEKGTDPYLLLQRTLKAEDRSHLPTVLDHCLAGTGLDLYVIGDEQMPLRPSLKDLLTMAEGTDREGERWGRALLRLGNLMAISARDISRLPLGEGVRKAAFVERASRALDLYRRAARIPELEPMARANQAMLRHWGGDDQGAVEELRSLSSSSDGARLQLAKVLWEMGRQEETAEVVAQCADPEGSLLRIKRGCQ
jgi:hypothetical protein